MKHIHHIHISVFVRKDEDSEAIHQKIIQFLPDKFKDEKITIEEQRAPIQDGVDLSIFEIKLNKTRHCKESIQKIKKFLGPKQCQQIAKDPTRVDGEGNLFLRIDKEQFVKNEETLLVDHGNCFHFKISIACYPKTKANALQVVQELFLKK